MRKPATLLAKTLPNSSNNDNLSLCMVLTNFVPLMVLLRIIQICSAPLCLATSHRARRPLHTIVVASDLLLVIPRKLKRFLHIFFFLDYVLMLLHFWFQRVKLYNNVARFLRMWKWKIFGGGNFCCEWKYKVKKKAERDVWGPHSLASTSILLCKLFVHA